jgi:hypothetical protein
MAVFRKAEVTKCLEKKSILQGIWSHLIKAAADHFLNDVIKQFRDSRGLFDFLRLERNKKL